jgi:DNA recombination protein RmuC
MTMDVATIVLGGFCAVLAIAVLALAFRTSAAVRTERRLEHERDDVRAALEAERAALRQAQAELQTAREDLREAAVHAARAPALEAKLQESEARANAAEKELEVTLTRASEREQAAQEKLQALADFRVEMEKQFKALSADALTAQSESFTKANKEKLEVLLAPLKEQINRFETDFKQDGQQRVAQRTAMETLVQSLKEQTTQVQNEAGALARALKGQAQTQGAWGEMILKTILEKAGLREGEEFVTQDSRTTEDGARHRPDVVVNFPDGKKLVVDSKVSLVAFERCVNCEEEAERAAHLKEHLTSLRRHIRSLSEKDYAQHYGGVDFVILFVPVEGALSLAIQNDPEIQSEAVSRNVMIASPNTLLMGLRTVQNMWTRERQSRNAEAIAERAGRLYEKFASFVVDLEKVGDSLSGARKQYDAAYGKLTGGPGNLVRQTELLKTMGARTNKQISDRTLALSDEREEEEMPDKAKAKPETKAEPQEQTKPAKPRGKANHPEHVPGLNGGAKNYDGLSEEEKLVADSISQDWDA